MNSLKKTARIAGLLYLLVAISSGFSQFFRTSVIVPDVATTINNISASGNLFRIAIVSDLVGQILHVFLALVLYELFKGVNKNRAILMAILALIPVPIAMLNQINTLNIMQLASNTNHQQALSTDFLHSQITVLLNLFDNGVNVAAIFWGLWLFPLGYLAIESDLIPKIIGILLIVAGAGYVADCLGKFLVPNYNINLAVLTFIGEIVFLFWLLIKGVNELRVNNSISA